MSIYVDEVYRGNPAGSAIQLFDLQRVEVLRGPQGTIYGRNTTGRLVHYVSKKPSYEFETSFSAEFGSYDQQDLRGHNPRSDDRGSARPCGGQVQPQRPLADQRDHG